MTEAMTQERAAPKHDKVRMVADDIVTANSLATHLGLHTAEHRAADGGSGDRAAQRWLLRPDRIAAEIHQAPALGASAVAAHAGRRRSRQGQDRNAATAPDGKAAQAGAPGGCQCTDRRNLRRRADASVGHGRTVFSRDMLVRRNIDAVVFQVRTELAQACTRMADERGEPPLVGQDRYS